MGIGDPDHKHPLYLLDSKEGTVCFRCELPFVEPNCFGCTRCDHFVHPVCLNLPQNMRHPIHPQHSLTLLPSPINSSSQIIDENCNQCLQPFLGGYAYHCQSCFKFNLHLKCFLTLKLETKHHHPLSLWDCLFKVGCRICGLLISPGDGYMFACEDCNFFIHYECTFIVPTVKHRHVHELTFEYNYPKGSKVVDCDVCLNNGGEELDRTSSYYYCERCDYIAHVRCVTTQPPKVTTQFDHFIHEHPMLFHKIPDHPQLRCAACKLRDCSDSFYFCAICNYALHNSCARFPRFIKHPRHKENHILSLQSCAQNKDCKLICCGFCTKELECEGWIFQCTSDCEFAIHISCAREFEHPLYEDGILYFSSYNETKFRCDACGELGDGSRISRRQHKYGLPHYDLHVECSTLPGQIEHGSHSHPLYLVNSPTEIKSNLSSVFQCDICHTEADPDLWVYCCEKCKYLAHLKCVVSDLLLVPGGSCDFPNFCSIAMCEKEKFRVRKIKLDDCSKFLEEDYYLPFFLPSGFYLNLKPRIGDHHYRSITSYVRDSDIRFTDVLCCPKCEKLISVQAYSSIWDWVQHNFKASTYNIQNEYPADYESLALLDEKVVEELYCPICNLLIFPPTYSCADCQIFFHKSCAELPRKYTMVANGHTFILQSPSMNNCSLSNCSQCKRPCKGYAYFCTSCEIGFDVTCALGAPLLKLENQKHNFSAMTWRGSQYHPLCNACHQCHTIGNIYFKCEVSHCTFSLHLECAMLQRAVKVKHRIHQHSLVLEPHLDLSVDDYICDVCEQHLNPCIWVYRCSDICGDRATFHVSCIVSSDKKCHFVYDEECSYPHLSKSKRFVRDYGLCEKKTVPALAAEIVNQSHWEEHSSVLANLSLFVDELEHENAYLVTDELMRMSQVEVFHLMESPDALRAKVAEIMKDLTPVLPYTNKEENAEDGEDN